MKEIVLTSSYLIGAAELVLAGYFWATNSKNEIRRVMTLLSASTGLWVIISAISSYSNPSPTVAIEQRVVYVFGLILLTALFHFTVIFPTRVFAFDFLHKTLIYSFALGVAFVALFTDTVVKGSIGSRETPGTVIQGPLFGYFNIYLLVLYVVSVILLGLKKKRMGGILKTNTNLVFWSVLLGGIPAVIADLVLTPLGFDVSGFIGTVSTIVWLGVTGYIVMKKG